MSLISSRCRFRVGERHSVEDAALGRPYGGLSTEDEEHIEFDGVREAEADVGVGSPPNDMEVGAGGEEFEDRNSSQEASLLLFVVANGSQTKSVAVIPSEKDCSLSDCDGPDVMGQSNAGKDP